MRRLTPRTSDPIAGQVVIVTGGGGGIGGAICAAFGRAGAIVAVADLAARVERHAEGRAIAWQERHIPWRFQDAMPWQLPRLWQRFQRQEKKYGDRLERA